MSQDPQADRADAEEQAAEAIYYDIRESFVLAMQGAGIAPADIKVICTTVDDAVGNHIEKLAEHITQALS